MSASGGGVNLGVAYVSIEMNLDGLRSSMSQAKNIFSDGLQGIGDSIPSAGQSMMQLGGNITALTAPLSTFGVAAISSAIQFDESMTNIGAVMGVTREEITAIGNELQAFGEGTRAGPQSVADAFYDIVGGVTDATTHMAILEAANRTAEAGNADLGETTNAMISIMNSYGFSAEEAAFASDVLTRTVGAGVGTMGEFASALPQVTGLANAMGIEFDDLAAQAAYLTTQGNTASQSATQLGAMMTTLQNPTQALADVIHGLGYENGQALVDAKGLSGAYAEIRRAAGGSFDGIITNTEALRGATALASDTFVEFADNFTSAVDGSTVAAQATQNQSFAAQLDLVKSAFQNLSITVGEVFLPVLTDMLDGIAPIIRGIGKFATENPALVRTLGMVAAAVAAVGAVLIPLGMALSAAGGLIGSLGAGFGLLLSPIGLLVAAVAAIGLAFATNFGGIRDIVQPIIDNIIAAIDYLVIGIGLFIEDIQNLGLGEAIKKAFLGDADGGGWVEGVIATFLGAGGQAVGIMREIAVAISTALGNVATFVIDQVIPALQQFANWFLVDVLPQVITFVTGTIIPAIQSFFDFLGQIWAIAAPALMSLADWFLVSALPAIQQFISGVVIPFITDFIAVLVRIWNDVSPFLIQLFDWFVNTGLPLVISYINGVVIPAVQGFINILAVIWATVSPVLTQLYDWFIVTALPAIMTFIEGPMTTAIQGFITLLTGIWTAVSPGLQSLRDGFQGVFDWIKTNVIDPFLGVINDIVLRVQDAAYDVNNFLGRAEGMRPSDLAAFQESISGAGAFGAPAVIPGRALGGDVMGGMPYMVGEAGPELFIPGQSGSIVPNNALAQGAGGDNFNITIYAADGTDAANKFDNRLRELRRANG